MSLQKIVVILDQVVIADFDDDDDDDEKSIKSIIPPDCCCLDFIFHFHCANKIRFILFIHSFISHVYYKSNLIKIFFYERNINYNRLYFIFNLSKYVSSFFVNLSNTSFSSLSRICCKRL